MTNEAEPIRRLVEIEGLFGTELMLGRTATEGGADERPSLESVRADLGECTRCPLHEGRTNIVFGEGSPDARLVFVGEGPGVNEDIEGRPFVGRAGKMLTAIIEKVFFLKRDDVYIANIVKCRPPGNRTPQPDECATCLPFLLRQLEAIAPEFLVALGGIASHNLLDTKEAIGRLRGRFHILGNIRVMPTYHPAYLLRNPAEKRKVFEDMLVVREAMGIKAPR
ncbi:MAG: uracil-DNA glycosylase [Planctomycetota bacterium]